MLLRPLGQDLWTATCDFRAMGMNLGGRMNVVRLPDGGLWLHSPIPLTAELLDEVKALGPVRHLVSPNLFHHLHLPDWSRAFPQAQVWAPPGLERKQPDLRIDHFHDEAEPHPWGDVLRAQPLAGLPAQGEVMFVHRPSATLMLADALLYLPSPEGRLTRLYARLSGVLERPARTALLRLITRDKAAAEQSIRALQGEPIERITICHAGIFEGDGHEALRRAWGVT